MGRKSNAKKVIRELLKEKEEEKKGILKKLKKQSKKDLKQELKASKKTEKPKKPKKKKKTPKKISPQNKQRIFGGLLSLIMISILIFIATFLLQKALKPAPIAIYLPAEQTVFSLELNTDINHLQNLKTFQLLENHPAHSLESIINKFETTFAINFDQSVRPWLGRNLGFAILNNETTTDQIIFIESTNHSLALKNLSPESEISTNEIYTLSQKKDLPAIFSFIDYPNNFTFIDSYVVFAQTPEILESIKTSTSERLYDSESYRRVDDNLPLQKIAFLYIDFKRIKSNQVPSLGPVPSQFISSFMEQFDSEGIALIAKDDKFAIQSFINIDTETRGEINTLEEKYQASLLKSIPEDTLAIWSAKDFEAKINRFSSAISPNIETILGNIASELFGSELNIDTDLLPLLKKEFVFFIDYPESLNLLFETSSQEDKEKIENILYLYAQKNAGFHQEISTHELEDGTIAKELVAVPKEVVKESITETKITVLRLPEKDLEIFYTFIDNLALISTSEESVQKIIRTHNGQHPNLKDSAKYDQMIKPVLSSADELTFFSLHDFLPILLPEIPSFFVPLDSFSSGKNYFNDGIVSINFLSIK